LREVRAFLKAQRFLFRGCGPIGSFVDCLFGGVQQFDALGELGYSSLDFSR